MREKFEQIIEKWLNIRDESQDIFWYEASEEDPFFPKYVMKMMREINELMPYPMLDEIKSLDTYCMGHADYFKKFSLRLTELYNKTKNE